MAIARQVVEGSASPMESALTLILCAPQSWGGFGLPQPQLNKSIPVDKSIRHLWSEEYITPDLLWESAKLVLEYDSTQHHTTSRQLARDASRRDIFQQMGFRVISVTGFHMSRPLELERVATLIAQHLEIDAPRIDIEQWNDRMSFTAHMLTLATQPEKLLALPRPKNVKRNWSSRWEPLLPFDPRE
ncbi:MAG: DUF559 domain-containing protein [Atopobiaceae bacterium]|nr:DUF559 domain-containing protein [Atopobiaceae bacterium]